MNVQTIYQTTIQFAAKKHLYQRLQGTPLPYLVHVCNVAMEVMAAAIQDASFDVPFAVQVALLHDTIEDTDASFEEIEELFGKNVATAVQALTKNENLPKAEAIPDSVSRIKKLGKEVWIVKLADRITNLQAPDETEDTTERIRYQKESQMILDELKDANRFLAERLQTKIEEYNRPLREII